MVSAPARLAAALQRGRGGARATASGAAHGSLRRLVAGEDAVDLVVVKALVGADRRAVEGDALDDLGPRRSISTVTARRSRPGRSEQASLDSASGSIGSTAPGT